MHGIGEGDDVRVISRVELKRDFGATLVVGRCHVNYVLVNGVLFLSRKDIFAIALNTALVMEGFAFLSLSAKVG